MVKHPPRFIGTNVAGDFAKLLLGADSELIKTGPGWGEQPGPAGLTTVKGGSGDSSLALSRRRAPLHGGRQSPQTITTAKENVSELLMITDSEIDLRDGGLVAIGGALGLLERGLRSGTANCSDANNRRSDCNRGPIEQLRDAAWHDSLDRKSTRLNSSHLG